MTVQATTALPDLARQILQRAAKTPNTPANPLARTQAIEIAQRKVRQLFPRYFK